MWVVDSGATHHLTALREVLRHVHKLEVPKTCGLAYKTASMKAKEVGSIEIRLRIRTSGHVERGVLRSRFNRKPTIAIKSPPAWLDC
jgi:hypothetical protein